jgi:methylisocitrate lyase
MCEKIQAAVAARRNAGLVLIARTDAHGVRGWDDAVARAQAYQEAGADWIFPEALTTAEEFARFARAVRAPLVANMTEFGKSPLLTLNELSRLGYAAVLYPVTLLRVAMQAATETLQEIQRSGTQQHLLDRMQTRQQLYDLLGYAGDKTRS